MRLLLSSVNRHGSLPSAMHCWFSATAGCRQPNCTACRICSRQSVKPVCCASCDARVSYTPVRPTRIARTVSFLSFPFLSFPFLSFALLCFARCLSVIGRLSANVPLAVLCRRSATRSSMARAVTKGSMALALRKYNCSRGPGTSAVPSVRGSVPARRSRCAHGTAPEIERHQLCHRCEA